MNLKSIGTHIAHRTKEAVTSQIRGDRFILPHHIRHAEINTDINFLNLFFFIFFSILGTYCNLSNF